MNEIKILRERRGAWSDGTPFFDYAVFVKTAAAPYCWQQISPWYTSRGWALNWCRRHGYQETVKF